MTDAENHREAIRRAIKLGMFAPGERFQLPNGEEVVVLIHLVPHGPGEMSHGFYLVIVLPGASSKTSDLRNLAKPIPRRYSSSTGSTAR